uniref:Neur_chan_LBD domain-containing protein n=1 Tax=Macrostomum lignano TaxID=282301 RepID=A0A1I8JI59_9PLAT
MPLTFISLVIQSRPFSTISLVLYQCPRDMAAFRRQSCRPYRLVKIRSSSFSGPNTVFSCFGGGGGGFASRPDRGYIVARIRQAAVRLSVAGKDGTIARTCTNANLRILRQAAVQSQRIVRREAVLIELGLPGSRAVHTDHVHQISEQRDQLVNVLNAGFARQAFQSEAALLQRPGVRTIARHDRRALLHALVELNCQRNQLQSFGPEEQSNWRAELPAILALDSLHDAVVNYKQAPGVQDVLQSPAFQIGLQPFNGYAEILRDRFADFDYERIAAFEALGTEHEVVLRAARIGWPALHIQRLRYAVRTVVSGQIVKAGEVIHAGIVHVQAFVVDDLVLGLLDVPAAMRSSGMGSAEGSDTCGVVQCMRSTERQNSIFCTLPKPFLHQLASGMTRRTSSIFLLVLLASMRRKCSVVGCKSNYESEQLATKVHLFPKDSVERERCKKALPNILEVGATAVARLQCNVAQSCGMVRWHSAAEHGRYCARSAVVQRGAVQEVVRTVRHSSAMWRSTEQHTRRPSVSASAPTSLGGVTRLIQAELLLDLQQRGNSVEQPIKSKQAAKPMAATAETLPSLLAELHLSELHELQRQPPPSMSQTCCCLGLTKRSGSIGRGRLLLLLLRYCGQWDANRTSFNRHPINSALRYLCPGAYSAKKVLAIAIVKTRINQWVTSKHRDRGGLTPPTAGNPALLSPGFNRKDIRHRHLQGKSAAIDFEFYSLEMELQGQIRLIWFPMWILMDILAAHLSTVPAVAAVHQQHPAVAPSTDRPRILGSAEKRLAQRLLQRYAEWGVVGRPVMNSSEVLTVRLGLALIQILDLEENQQRLRTNCWLRFTWKDSLLAWEDWSDSEFQDIKQIRALLKSTCKVKILNFPFDTQECRIKFGSWTYDESQLMLDWSLTTIRLNATHTVPKPLPFVDFNDYVKSNEWETDGEYELNIADPDQRLKQMRSVISYRNETGFDSRGRPVMKRYRILEFCIRMMRNPSFYVAILVVPCILLSMLTLVIFWLPPESPAKILLGMNIFVAFFILLLLLAEQIPSAVETFPLIGCYYCMNMGLITFSTFVAAVIVNLHFHGDKSGPVPPLLRRLLLTCPPDVESDLKEISRAIRLFLGRKKDADAKNLLAVEWRTLAQVLDRLFFLLYVILLISFLILFIPRRVEYVRRMD